MLYLWVYERCIRQRRQESEVKKMLAETICRIKKTGLMGIVRVETIERGIENGVDSVGLGGLLTKGSSADIAENARKLRAIVEESRKAD